MQVQRGATFLDFRKLSEVRKIYFKVLSSKSSFKIQKLGLRILTINQAINC